VQIATDEDFINKEYIKIKDYIYRNESINSLNIYSYASKYIKKKNSKKKNPADIVFPFQKSHPQYLTHEIVKRKYIFIPVLISPSFPRRKDETKIELYCQLMLLLLKP
jgi:hypothetical protein